jgi:uncharacterized protein YbjT (DUF2867 family)
MGIIGQMQGFALVTTPPKNKSGTAIKGRCCSASDNPDCNIARVTTGEIITSLGALSRTALVAGATGLIGNFVLQFLLADDAWSRVVTVGRRITPHKHEKLEQRVLDLGELETVSDLPHIDDVFCCLGTTIKQAGSQPAFRRVDHAFVMGLAHAGLRAGATQFLLVSAIGADPESRVFYSRVKGETEWAIRTLPYQGIQIFRPSLLLGERPEFRLAERIAMLGAPVLPALLFGRLRRYRPIQAATVARAMVGIALEVPRGPNVFEYDAMRAATA